MTTPPLLISDGPLACPIGPEHPPVIIAELSGNHNGSLQRALELIDAAAAAGCQAVKFQTYTADTMTLPSREGDFVVRDPASPWHGRSLHDLYAEAATPWAWHPQLFAHARGRGLIPLSSPFDASAVALLEGLNCPCYKIASFELVDLPLIRCCAATGKPLIMSTGMATLEEIAEAVAAARAAGCAHPVLLRCSSAYPAPAAGIGLSAIADLAQRFDIHSGLSDHTLGSAVAVAAVALGAVVIEKHLCGSRAEGGVDSSFSLEPAELAALVHDCFEAAAASRGALCYGPRPEEAQALKHRRSLYVVRPVAAGAVLSADDLRSLRPAGGLSPAHLDQVLGRRVLRDLAVGTALSWDDVEQGSTA